MTDNVGAYSYPVLNAKYDCLILNFILFSCKFSVPAGENQRAKCEIRTRNVMMTYSNIGIKKCFYEDSSVKDIKVQKNRKYLQCRKNTHFYMHARLVYFRYYLYIDYVNIYYLNWVSTIFSLKFAMYLKESIVEPLEEGFTLSYFFVLLHNYKLT